jgi:hypothetical protein
VRFESPHAGDNPSLLLITEYAILRELFGQLDGFENNDGVIFIATANDLA